jgi:hypothetical protein
VSDGGEGRKLMGLDGQLGRRNGDEAAGEQASGRLKARLLGGDRHRKWRAGKAWTVHGGRLSRAAPHLEILARSCGSTCGRDEATIPNVDYIFRSNMGAHKQSQH